MRLPHFTHVIQDPQELNIDLSTPEKTNEWIKELRQRLWATRWRGCDCCGKPLHGKVELHEGIVTRRDVQGWRYPEKAYIFSEYNCIWLRQECHINPPSRERVWEIQCARYGEKAVRGWYESLPFKSTPRRFGHD